MTMIGYARVSTLDQDLSLQLAAGIAAAKARGSIRGDRPRSMPKLSNASYSGRRPEFDVKRSVWTYMDRRAKALVETTPVQTPG